MKITPRAILRLLPVLGLLLASRLAASVEYDARIPQLAFAARELENALSDAGREDLHVTLKIQPGESSPEAFRIRSVGSTQIEVTGSDRVGTMYGGLEVAKLLRLGLPLEDQDRAPFVGNNTRISTARGQCIGSKTEHEHKLFRKAFADDEALYLVDDRRSFRR